VLIKNNTIRHSQLEYPLERDKEMLACQGIKRDQKEHEGEGTNSFKSLFSTL